jgi:hypothetical protein
MKRSREGEEGISRGSGRGRKEVRKRLREGHKCFRKW